MNPRSLIVLCLLTFTGIHFLYAEKSQKRSLPQFSEILLNASATIHLTQADVQEVALSGEEQDLKNLITEVNQGKLIIRYPEGYERSNFLDYFFGKRNVDIRISMKQIDRLAVSGTGNITADGKIEAKTLDLSLSGTGNVRFADLKAEEISSRISGTGNLYLAGKQAAAKFSSSISGVGNVKAIDFRADDANVQISGVGTCRITVNKNLVARISGIGSLYYRGHPKVDSRVSGIGKVKEEK